jgi:hypothetical protein
MAIKSMGIIRLHDNMNLHEINQVRVKISDLKGNEKIRAKINDSGKSNATIFAVYKNTFSERSLHKLEKLKNIFINKKLSENSCLTKGILGKNSISVEEVKIFIEGKNAAIQKNLDDEIKKLEDEFGLKDITIEDLRNDEEITDIKQQKNPNEISIEILDDQPILMDIIDENEFIISPALEISSQEKIKLQNNLDKFSEKKSSASKLDSTLPPNPKIAAKLTDMDILQNNLAELGLFHGDVKKNENKNEINQSESKKEISKNTNSLTNSLFSVFKSKEKISNQSPESLKNSNQLINTPKTQFNDKDYTPKSIAEKLISKSTKVPTDPKILESRIDASKSYRNYLKGSDLKQIESQVGIFSNGVINLLYKSGLSIDKKMATDFLNNLNNSKDYLSVELKNSISEKLNLMLENNVIIDNDIKDLALKFLDQKV